MSVVDLHEGASTIPIVTDRTENGKKYSFLPLGAVVYVSSEEISEFCSRNPLHRFSTGVYLCAC